MIVVIILLFMIFCFYLFQQYSQPQQTLYSVQQQVCLILTVYITNNLKNSIDCVSCRICIQSHPHMGTC